MHSIKKLTTTAYHPQTDGLVERLNSTVCQTLSMYVSKNQKDWDVFIPAALIAFRTSPSESTGESTGQKPRRPMEVSLLPPGNPTRSIAKHHRKIVRNIELSRQIAHDNIARAQQKMEYYDRTAKESDYVEGSKVCVLS